MSEVQVIAPEVTALDIIRAEAVSNIMRGYGATKVYAESLFGWFDSDWYTYAHNDKSESAKPILEEGQKFRDALRKAGHTNPSVAWTRVRQEGQKLAEGNEDSDGEGETESAGTKEVRSLSLRLIEELAKLHNACKREADKNNLDAKQSDAHTYIVSALTALGVDVATLK